MAKIGLDVGHGRNTFPPSKGVYKNGKAYHEYDANSRVARKLEAKLKNAGHSVYKAQPYNADDVNLTTRTQRYFANNVDLIISCHANAGVAGANGYASFYWQGDSKAKRFSDLYVEEIAKQGFKLWGGSRPSVRGTWSSFHMCSVPSSRGIPSILIENGFMTHSGDFEWIFGSKKEEYAERCATAAFNAIQRFLGNSVSTTNTGNSSASSSKPEATSRNYLQKGDKGTAVKNMQDKLIKAGYRLPKYGADSDYGNETEQAVRQLQIKHSLVVDGLFGKATSTVLDNELKNRTPSKPSKKKSPKIEWVGTYNKGKRLEAIASKVNYYDTQRWSSPTGQFIKGEGWVIDNLYRVNGSLQYRVKNTNGDIYYTTARNDLVRVINKSYVSAIKPNDKVNNDLTLPTGTYRANRPYPSGPKIRTIQEALVSLNFYPNKNAKNNGVDDVYGPDTADAVRRFQLMNGLVADGIYGPKTKSKMEQKLK